MKPKLIAAVAILSVALLFVAQNSQQVKVRFLFVSTDPLPLSVMLFGILVLGFVCGFLIAKIGKGRR